MADNPRTALYLDGARPMVMVEEPERKLRDDWRRALSYWDRSYDPWVLESEGKVVSVNPHRVIAIVVVSA